VQDSPLEWKIWPSAAVHSGVDINGIGRLHQNSPALQPIALGPAWNRPALRLKEKSRLAILSGRDLGFQQVFSNDLYGRNVSTSFKTEESTMAITPQEVITILALIGVILAWLAKMLWSRDYRISKQAEIDALKERITTLEAVSAGSLLGHMTSRKNLFDQAMADIGMQLSDANQEILDLTERIMALNSEGKTKGDLLEKATKQRDEIAANRDELQKQLEQSEMARSALESALQNQQTYNRWAAQTDTASASLWGSMNAASGYFQAITNLNSTLRAISNPMWQLDALHGAGKKSNQAAEKPRDEANA
jgi:predicted  nucleic acid-binding Zn-ribbon protein